MVGVCGWIYFLNGWVNISREFTSWKVVIQKTVVHIQEPAERRDYSPHGGEICS